MKVSCLTATYGRYTQLSKAVSCFLAQDYHDKELIILNTHPVEIVAPFPGVTVYNEPEHNDLGSCRNRLLTLATGEYINTWDDDDWWFPWHLSQAMGRMGPCGWKPEHSWFYQPPKHMEKAGNAFEASIVFKKSEVEKIGYKSGQGDEHVTLFSIPITIEPVSLEQMSYVYTWGMGMHHASGTLGSSTPLETRVANWKAAHQDHGDRKPLNITDLDWLFNLRSQVC
jgi:hypothetical protein